MNKTKGARYTPLSKRADKPNGIYWLVKNLPNIPDSKFAKLIELPKNPFNQFRDRSYWNIQNIRSQNPYELGLCTKTEIEDIIEKYKKYRLKIIFKL